MRPLTHASKWGVSGLTAWATVSVWWHPLAARDATHFPGWQCVADTLWLPLSWWCFLFSCSWLTFLAAFLLADTLSYLSLGSLSPGWHYLLPLYRWHFLVFLSYADSRPSPDNPCLFILIADIYYLPPPNLLFSSLGWHFYWFRLGADTFCPIVCLLFPVVNKPWLTKYPDEALIVS